MDVRIDYEDLHKIGRLIGDVLSKNNFGGKYSKVYNRAVDECYKAYNDNIYKTIKAYMRHPDWIDVRDSLPPEEAKVLVTTKEKALEIAYRTDTPWNNRYTWSTYDDILSSDEVTAWMPLPQPYEDVYDKICKGGSYCPLPKCVEKEQKQ